MDSLQLGDLTIDPVGGGPGADLRLVCRGRANDHHHAEVLPSYLDAAVEQAARGGASLIVDLTPLEQANSSMIATLVQLISTARQRTVPLAYVYDPAKRWQRINLQAFTVFVSDHAFALRVE